MVDFSGSEPERSYRISAVEKAFAVVDAFCSEPYRLTLAEVSARTGLSSNQAFRVLQTLVAAGYVRQVQNAKQYALGPAAFRLVAPLLNADELFQASREIVDSFFDSTGEISSVSAFNRGEETVCIYVRLNEQPFVIPTAIGVSSNDLHAGAVARTLLASRSDAEIDEGMYGIAAPVFDRRGALVAAVSLVAPLVRAGAAERERHLALLLDAAK